MSDPFAPITITIQIQNGPVTAIYALAAQCELSRQQLKQAMSKGAVWLQIGKRKQRLRRATRMLNNGELLSLYYDKTLLALPVITPQLVADFGLYSVWIKPAGMLSQGTEWGDHCSLLRFSEQAFAKPRHSFLVQRLDREAYGVMIIAHQRKAAGQLSALFQQRKIDKQYQVWVDGEVPWQQHRMDRLLDGKQAVSHFEKLSYDTELNRTQLHVRIETGRKHQIRRHCAAAGYPVSGDVRYGQKSHDGLQLKASKLVFNCPVTHKKQEFSY